MARIKLFLAFLLSFLSLIIFPALLPALRLTFFAPFLIITYYKSSLKTALWLSLGSGILLDLLSSHQRLGLGAIGYCLTTFLLYPWKRNFFEDRWSTLPLMTLLFAVLSSCFQVCLLALLDQPISLSLKWVWTDLLLMPILDGLYAFVLFTLPGIFMPKAPQHEFFFKKAYGIAKKPSTTSRTVKTPVLQGNRGSRPSGRS